MGQAVKKDMGKDLDSSPSYYTLEEFAYNKTDNMKTVVSVKTNDSNQYFLDVRKYFHTNQLGSWYASPKGLCLDSDDWSIVMPLMVRGFDVIRMRNSTINKGKGVQNGEDESRSVLPSVDEGTDTRESADRPEEVLPAA